jgi:hypothetical protein
MTTPIPAALDCYRTDYVCTYQDHIDKENDFFVNLRYQLDFLRLFGQTVYDDDVMTDLIGAIYDTFKDNPDFKTILSASMIAGNLAKGGELVPKQWALMWCYSFGLMHVMHPFVSYLIIHGTDAPACTLENPEYLAIYNALSNVLINAATALDESEEDVVDDGQTLEPDNA